MEPVTESFRKFFDSEKSGGLLLIAATAVSLVLANSPVGPAYRDFWRLPLGGLSVELWINDLLMAVFFLLIGLELERELYVGELSTPGNALLPMFGALGGIAAPAAIHLALNAGTPTRAGFGIPMATDIAFALGVLAILGRRVPPSLRIFLAALAVMDDLAAIVLIAVFYTSEISVAYLVGALAVFGALVALNRLRVTSLAPYIVGGALMWFLMLKSGVHATISGVLLAFAVPFTKKDGEAESPSHRLEHFLYKPVALAVLPLFALANTAIVVGADWADRLATPNGAGIIAGLLLGKPAGITLLSFAAVAAGVCRLPQDLGWRHLAGAGMLGGIGFTMSIFITNLAFGGDPAAVDASKIAILLASLTAGVAGFLWLRAAGKGGAVSPSRMAAIAALVVLGSGAFDAGVRAQETSAPRAGDTTGRAAAVPRRGPDSLHFESLFLRPTMRLLLEPSAATPGDPIFLRRSLFQLNTPARDLDQNMTTIQWMWKDEVFRGKEYQTLWNIVGAVEAGAVGYLAYRHIKRYGLK